MVWPIEALKIESCAIRIEVPKSRGTLGKHETIVLRVRVGLVSTLFGLLLAFCNMYGQTSPNAREILEKVVAVYRGASSYEMVVDRSMDVASEEKSLSTRIKFKSPNKYRVEISGELRSQGKDPLTAIAGLMVFDGSTWWGYSPESHEYRSAPSSPIDADGMGLGPFRDVLGDFERQRGKSMRIVGEDRLSTGDGKAHQCFVVELIYPQETNRLWIEKNTYLVLRMKAGGATLTYRNVQLGVSLADDVFRFTPPPGARKVEGARQ